MLHGEERMPGLVRLKVVYGHDGGMLELPLNTRFADEARAQVVARTMRGEHLLHGDVAADVSVVRDAYLTHSPGAERRDGRVALGGWQRLEWDIELVEELARWIPRKRCV